MKSITVGQLRQNPTQMLTEVEAGATYRITRHNREVGRIIPSASGSELIPAKKRGPARTSSLAPLEVQTAESLDELINEMRGEW
ncbi:MAG TPA: type II toxin-antitoxin system prevent-host-death family antitoxin [Microbacterium sp.]|nr:type II toxin-antitoxin system prevent-host-death family antitoxin [Microbacterium sp.]